MKKSFLFALAIGASLTGNAQTLSPSVISSGGGYSTHPGGSLSYTVGEMSMVQTFAAGNTVLTQGFQQPTDKLTALVDMTRDAFGSFAVYPSLAIDNVWFGLELPEAGHVSVVIFDAQGKKVSEIYNGIYTSGKLIHGANVSVFAAGNYFLTMTFTSDKTQKVHTTSKQFQIIL